MEVSCLPLSPSQRSKLVSAGYTTISSLSSISPSHLARDLNVSHDEAVEILKIASHSHRFDPLIITNNSKTNAIVTGTFFFT
ncbi:hypothetical protein IFM89_031718 [Coptis chinensis]|uniref:Uncharacterized protein n=1 Tax=Coptis chinensis TaxID=261450 RepID=A0A835IFG0_9MAGN|nr:hypothetical protein IFM89_031718 [Coptis chinensis]